MANFAFAACSLVATVAANRGARLQRGFVRLQSVPQERAPVVLIGFVRNQNEVLRAQATQRASRRTGAGARWAVRPAGTPWRPKAMGRCAKVHDANVDR